MMISAGNKIKTLRRKLDITQERLAEYMGITPQAVSRWESETCYPDIEMLPALADYFNITVDELLCVDQSKKEEKIMQSIKTAHEMQSNGKFDEAVSVLRVALGAFPSSFLLQAELACAIGAIDDGNKISNVLCDEAIGLCSRILDDCLDDNLRLRAKAILGFVYVRHLGDMNKAKHIISSLPVLYQCRDTAMAETLKILPPSPEAKENIVNAIGHLLILFGNKLGYNIEQHFETGADALIVK